jgi:hypothetical protein
MNEYKNVISILVLTFSGIFALTLFSFGIFQNYLILQNITSNEHLRGKWNARKTKVLRERPSICVRLRYFYCSKLPESKVEAYY